MKMNDTVKFLIPLVAVVVIIESVVLVTGVLRKGTGSVVDNTVVVNGTKVSPVVTVVKTPTMVDLVFEVGTRTMNVGKQYPVSLNMLTKKDYQVDTFDVYVKYDPLAVDVSGLTFDKRLGKPAFSKISKDKGLIVANVYMSDPKGVKVAMSEVLKMMSFSVTPKKSGLTTLEVSAGNANGESATMLVENGTSKVIPFSSNKLEVTVIK